MASLQPSSSCGVSCTQFLHEDHKGERSPGIAETCWSRHTGFVLGLHTVACFSAGVSGSCLTMQHCSPGWRQRPDLHSFTSAEASVLSPFRQHPSCPVCTLGAGARTSSPLGEAPALLPHVARCPCRGTAHQGSPQSRCSTHLSQP